jgi:molecular chaperone GrpE
MNKNKDKADKADETLKEDEISTSEIETDENSESLDLNEKIKELEQNFLYAKAELQNYMRRADEEAIKIRKFAIENFSQELLIVKDSLEASLNSEKLTIENLQDGVSLTLKQLVSIFEKFNIVEINPLDQKFDPNEHQAMSMIESDKEPNTIISVLQKGYKLNERVIRPAMVSVSKAKEA